MKTYVLAALGALLLLAALSAHAQTCAPAMADPVPRDAARLSWTPPTQNTDNSPITKAMTFTIYEGAVAKCSTTNASQTSAGLTGLSVGVHTWQVTAKTADGESAKSNMGSKTVLPAPPNPPTNLLTDPASLVAYSPLKSDANDGTVFVAAVGTVAPGTQCDTTQGVFKDGVMYYVVPARSVTLANPRVKPTALVAKCS